jgi:predicted dehydrogenase
VFDGTPYPAQRPSWNYRKETGGGIILDMFAHWRYIFDRLLGEIKAVSCRHITALQQRRDENGQQYDVDVEDTAFAIFELTGGVLAQVGSSWASRVRRDDLLQIHVDGVRGLGGMRPSPLLCPAASHDAQAVFRPGAPTADEIQ